MWTHAEHISTALIGKQLSIPPSWPLWGLHPLPCPSRALTGWGCCLSASLVLPITISVGKHLFVGLFLKNTLNLFSKILFRGNHECRAGEVVPGSPALSLKIIGPDGAGSEYRLGPSTWPQDGLPAKEWEWRLEPSSP